MIIIKTTLDVLPEKQLEVLQTLLSLIAPVEEEPGCISCFTSFDISDKNRFTVLGEWESAQHLNHHIRSLRFGILLGTKTLLSGPIKIQIHTVSKTEGMEVIHAARKKQKEL